MALCAAQHDVRPLRRRTRKALIAVVDGFGASSRYFPNSNLNAAFVIVEA
jgi:hypothetical protein